MNARLYISLATLLFLFVAVRNWLIPFSHDEVATFYFYIQPGSFFPFYSHVDANGHFLTSALGWISYKIFGSSPFALRLPSLLAFGLLLYAVWQFRLLFVRRASWLLFAALMLLLYPFVAYFSLCRGYAPAMACLLMSLYYFFSFLRENKVIHMAGFLLFGQLALAASLTLLFVLLLLTACCALVFVSANFRFSFQVILLLVVHLGLIAYWTVYAFYLKDHGALYYGSGESYYNVTFRTLIHNLFGNEVLAEWLCIALFAVILICSVAWLVRKKLKPEAPFAISIFLLISLIFMFFFLKLLLGVNYPEDRTGLFFYLLFVCSISFAADTLRPRFAAFFVLPVFLLLLFPLRTFSLDIHPWALYETMPPRFYHHIKQAQQVLNRPVTIASHRVREFIFGFLNFRNGGELTHPTAPEELRMNCDFAIAVEADRPWYAPYYTAIDSDEVFNYRLLQRKFPLIRDTMIRSYNKSDRTGESEFLNVYEVSDTSFAAGDYLQADVAFTVEEAPVPWQAWLVLQIDTDSGQSLSRTPLDLVKGDWNRQTATLSLISEPMPPEIKRLVLYFWNQKKSPVRIKIHSFAISRISGHGVHVISKAKL